MTKRDQALELWEAEQRHVQERIDKMWNRSYNVYTAQEQLVQLIVQLRAEARAEVIVNAMTVGREWGGGVYPAIAEAVTDIRLFDTGLAERCDTCGHTRAVHAPAPVQMPCGCCEVEGFWQFPWQRG